MTGLGSQQRRQASRDWEHSDWTQWSETQVSSWVRGHLGLPYGDIFVQNRIDGPTLLELTDQDLNDYLEIWNPLHRKKLLAHTKLLRKSLPLLEEAKGNGFDPGIVTALTRDRHQSYTPPAQADQAAGDSPRRGYASLDNSENAWHGHDEDQGRPVTPKLHPAVAANVRRSQSQPPYPSDARPPPSPCYSGHGQSSEPGGGTAALDVLSPSLSHYGFHRKQQRGKPTSPGPNSYLVERSSVPMPNSPRAVIGRNRRDLTEHFINPLHCSPGAGKHGGYLAPRRVVGGSFGTAARWNYDRKNICASLGY